MPIYTILQILFFVTELSLLIFKRSKTAGLRSALDKRSLLILWIVISAALTLGPYSSFYGIWSFSNALAITCAGITVYFIGFTIRWTAVIQLGKMFTVDVAIDEQHTLKTTGLYKVIRHPSYFGLILIIAGLGVCMNSVLSFTIMVIPTFLAVNYRISVEEKALTTEFGEQYTSYKTRVKKIIPSIY